MSKVGRRGQITIPKEIRRRIDLKQGDHIAFVLSENQVIIQPINQTLLDLRGSVPVQEEQDFEAIRQQVTNDEAKRNVYHGE